MTWHIIVGKASLDSAIGFGISLECKASCFFSEAISPNQAAASCPCTHIDSNRLLFRQTNFHCLRWNVGLSVKTQTLVTVMIGVSMYTLTVGRVLNTVFQINLGQFFSETLSKSGQAHVCHCSLNGQLGLHKNQCMFQKIHNLSMGGALSRSNLLPEVKCPGGKLL